MDIRTLINKKFDIEEKNADLYRKIQKMRRERLQNIKTLDKIENDLRTEFNRISMNRSIIR